DRTAPASPPMCWPLLGTRGLRRRWMPASRQKLAPSPAALRAAWMADPGARRAPEHDGCGAAVVVGARDGAAVVVGAAVVAGACVVVVLLVVLVGVTAIVPLSR